MPDLNTSGYSPLAAGAPAAGLQQAQDLADQLYQQQLGRLNQGTDIANAGYAGMGQAAQQQSGDYSALKDLLMKTQQRLGELQYGPSQQEQNLRTLGAMAGEKPSLQGIAGVGAAGANAAAQGMQQTREGDITREQLMAKYGIDAQQAGMMAHQMQMQMAQNQINRGQQLSGNASTALNANLGRQIAASKDQAAINPSLVAELAAAKAQAAMQAQLDAMKGAGGQGQAQDPHDDPITNAYAAYQLQFPNQPQARGPQGALALRLWQDQLGKILQVNPQFQQGNKTIADKVRTNFDEKNGDNIRFVGNVAGHIQQYDQLMQQLQQSGLQEGMPGWNKIIQFFSKQMGAPEVTNLKGIQSFLGPEFAKVIVPSGATGEERKERESMIAASMSPDQWGGLKTNLQDALGTQLSGFENQFKSGLYFMPKELTDKEWGAKLQRPELAQISALHAQQSQQAPQGQQPSAGDLAYLKAHPESAPKFKAHFGFLPP